MGNWQLEAAKMFLYLSFPVGAFIWFNHPLCYEQAMRQTLESVSSDIDVDTLRRMEKANRSNRIDSLGETIAELEGAGPRKD